MMAVEAWQVPLWDAINRYVMACRGDPSKHVYGNTTRQKAVAEVCGVVRDATEDLRKRAEGAEAALSLQTDKVIRLETELRRRRPLAQW